MKRMILLLGIAALGLTGCAHRRHYAHYEYDRSYAGEHPVIVDRDGNRIYVREYDRDYRGSPDYQNNMEPRVRGKHADSMGWNTENYYLQRGYRE
jgi:hypothetical protein